jgi:hypothetical protein
MQLRDDQLLYFRALFFICGTQCPGHQDVVRLITLHKLSDKFKLSILCFASCANDLMAPFSEETGDDS